MVLHKGKGRALHHMLLFWFVDIAKNSFIAIRERLTAIILASCDNSLSFDME